MAKALSILFAVTTVLFAVLYFFASEAADAKRTRAAAGTGREPAAAGQAGATDEGAVNQGLRLRLSVTTTVEKGIDVHSVRLNLLNVGAAPIILVAHWPYEENKGDYAEFFKSEVGFLSFPEVVPESAQTAGSVRTSPQPEQEIGPGGSLTVGWTAKGCCLKEKDHQNTTPCFPSDGLYGVRARIIVVTKDGKRVLLVSNEQPVVVGGSLQIPKYATGRVVSGQPDKKAVTIDLGSDQKIEKGDQFMIRWGLEAAWRVTVTEVGTWFCEGAVEVLHHSGRETPLFPETVSIATRIPGKVR